MSGPEKPRKSIGGTMRLAGLGVELAAAVGGACLLGYWIDRRLDTSPWGILILATIGVVGGLYNMIRQSVHEMLPPGSRREHPGHGKPWGDEE